MTTDDDRALRAAGMPGAESTSARLRQALRDLAASQTDLTRVERDYDALLADNDHLAARFKRERDLARAELASARKELANAARSSWIVARDGGRDCVSCEQEIQRGEAYELLPGVDELQHVHCPAATCQPTEKN